MTNNLDDKYRIDDNDRIDEKDRMILEVLKEHADYTTRQIAKKTLLPITTVHHRIQKLRALGVIEKYTIEVDSAVVGEGFAAYVLVSVNLPLLRLKKKTQYDVVRDLKRFSFVKRADIVSGGTDVVVFLRVRDVAEFDSVLLGKIQLVEGVEKTQSLIVIHGR